MEDPISGIQQVGIGVPDAREAFDWYKNNFGTDCKIFEENGVVDKMLRYTGNETHERRAILGVNLQGGGGYEIWQYTSRTPEAQKEELQIGDTGILCSKINTLDLKAAYKNFKNKKLDLQSEIIKDPIGNESFFIKDPYGNLFQFVSSDYQFIKENKLNGGINGVIIGTSDIDKILPLYQEALGYNEVVYDKKGTFDDLSTLPSGNLNMRRVLLKHKEHRQGPFSKLLGPSQIELIQTEGRTPNKIFENRFWGDLGFIHLCFDVKKMDQIKLKCEKAGYQFTVDSAESFDMGEAAGHFSYIEDHDGTLIEFVQTYKVPIVKRIGLFLNLKNRDPEKILPKWMLKGLSFNKVKK